MTKETYEFGKVRVEVTTKKWKDHNIYEAYICTPAISSAYMKDGKWIIKKSTPSHQLYSRALAYRSAFRRPSLKRVLMRWGYGSLYKEEK